LTSEGGHEINIALPEGLDPGLYIITSVSDENANYIINVGTLLLSTTDSMERLK